MFCFVWVNFSLKLISLLQKFVSVTKFACVYREAVFKTNALVSILFIFVTNLSCTVFLTTSLFTTLLGLHKSTGTVFDLSTSILSTSAFNLGNFHFDARLDVSNPVAFLKSFLLHN